MKLLTGLAGALALVCMAASAQPAAPKSDSKLETVIVTAPKFHAGVTPNAIAHDFVKSFAAPTVLRDGIARWQVAICPYFGGLMPEGAAVMETRLRTIAGQTGVRMKNNKGCRPNLIVISTPQPQVYLDAIHAKNVEVLGYHGATIVTHPIQAWYVTGTEDIRGEVTLDEDISNIVGCDMSGCHLTEGNMTSSDGWRAHPDVSSDLLYVTIIIDSSKTGSYRVGEITDYVTMLALSQTQDYDDCQLMPSITNLLSANCDDKLKPSEIAPTDIAYLKGVYKMDAGAKLQIQQNQIAAEMEKAIPATAVPAGGGK
jgi:hypothetical protein